MRAQSQAVFESADAVLIEGGGLFGTNGQVIVAVLLRFDREAFEKGSQFIQHSQVSDRRHIAAGRIRQPQVVTRNMRPNPASFGRMPPMLHVPFAELMRRGAEEMLAREGRFGVDE